jgi:hypothetical protein
MTPLKTRKTPEGASPTTRPRPDVPATPPSGDSSARRFLYAQHSIFRRFGQYFYTQHENGLTKGFFSDIDKSYKKCYAIFRFFAKENSSLHHPWLMV